MKKFIIIAFILIGAISCTNDFSAWNVDPKQATEIPASTLFSNAEITLVRTVKGNGFFSNLAQYWTATTYPEVSNYDVRAGGDATGSFWNSLFIGVLIDLKESTKILTAETATLAPALLLKNKNQLAVVSILEVYTYHVLVDVFGDVPFTEALDIENPSPKYDNDTDIYVALFTKLDGAIANLNETAGSFGGADFIYNGDVSSWKKFAIH